MIKYAALRDDADVSADKKVWYSKQVLAVLMDVADIGAEKRRLPVHRCGKEGDCQCIDAGKKATRSIRA